MSGEGAIDELVDDAAEACAIGVDDIPGEVLAGGTQGVDLGRGEAEDRLVLAARQIDDLDVRAVHGAEREGAVHHELHVRSAGGLLAGRGDLLGDFGGRVDKLGVRDAEVRDEADLHDVVDARIVVDDLGHTVDQADDFLGEGVARGGFAGEDEGGGLDLEIRIGEATVIEVHNLHDVQELALVGVEALDLDVEDRVRVDGEAALA